MMAFQTTPTAQTTYIWWRAGTNVKHAKLTKGQIRQPSSRQLCSRRRDPKHRKVETVRAPSDHRRLVTGFERVGGKRDFHAHAALQAVSRGQDKGLVAMPHGDP